MIDKKIWIEDFWKYWSKRKFISNDPYERVSLPLYIFLKKRKSNVLNSIVAKEPSFFDRFIRYLVSPLYQFKYFFLFLNFVYNTKQSFHPKTGGLILQGICNILNNKNIDYESKIIWKKRSNKIIDMMISSIQTEKILENYWSAWGMPFRWVNDEEFDAPANAPQATATVVNAIAICEFIEICEDEKLKIKLKSIIMQCLNFFLLKLPYRKYTDSIAFSYTFHDNTHIINVNAHIAGFIAKASNIVSLEDVHLKYAQKCVNFVFDSINQDYSWDYQSFKYDKIKTPVDNTHTGDNIEYLIYYDQIHLFFCANFNEICPNFHGNFE